MINTLSPNAARRSLRDEGVAIVDVRPAPEFSRGHPVGSLCVPYSDRGLATRIHVAEPDVTAVILVTPLTGPSPSAAAQLDESGITLVGHGPDDQEWWAQAGVGWQTLREQAIDDVAGSSETVVIDVREPMEWATGHVPGAMLIPLRDVHARLDAIPRDQEIVLICEAGIRSATAASILQKAGYRNVSHAPEGTSWIRQTGGALDHSEPTSVEAV